MNVLIPSWNGSQAGLPEWAEAPSSCSHFLRQESGNHPVEVSIQNPHTRVTSESILSVWLWSKQVCRAESDYLCPGCVSCGVPCPARLLPYILAKLYQMLNIKVSLPLHRGFPKEYITKPSPSPLKLLDAGLLFWVCTIRFRNSSSHVRFCEASFRCAESKSWGTLPARLRSLNASRSIVKAASCRYQRNL